MQTSSVKFLGDQLVFASLASRMRVQVPKKEFILRGLSEDDTRDWFDVMRPIPQVYVARPLMQTLLVPVVRRELASGPATPVAIESIQIVFDSACQGRSHDGMCQKPMMCMLPVIHQRRLLVVPGKALQPCMHTT